MTEASYDWQKALDILYRAAAFVCADCGDADELVQESMIAYFDAIRRGEKIANPKAWLERVLRNRFNGWLRRKYANRIVSYEVLDGMPEEEAEDVSEEYAEVRREIGRLMKIYREVVVRHYVRGQSVDVIAAELGIPRGTVLSRLHKAREQIREGLEMAEKYSLSFAPKEIGVGIQGGIGAGNEPFSLVRSKIESNMLYLAYEKPISLREIADTMGIPMVYLEEFADRLTQGELMGRTAGGLLYTRCFMTDYRDSFGDIAARKALADEMAAEVWQVSAPLLAPLDALESVAAMTDKQRATLTLFVLLKALYAVRWRVMYPDGYRYEELPRRSGGGRWVATLTVYPSEAYEHCRYEASGPMQAGIRDDNGTPLCTLYDAQTLFGDAHWAYGNLPMRFDETEILRLYASLVSDKVKKVQPELLENLAFFENLHIIRRDADGKAVLDVPALTFEEERVMNDAIRAVADALTERFREPLMRLHAGTVAAVPAHVDERARFLHEGTLGVWPIAQLESITAQGLLPHPVEIGRTPLIVVICS